MSKYRPAVPVVVLTNKESVARQAAVMFGQYAVLVDRLDNLQDLIKEAKEFAKQKVGYLCVVVWVCVWVYGCGCVHRAVQMPFCLCPDRGVSLRHPPAAAVMTATA